MHSTGTAIAFAFDAVAGLTLAVKFVVSTPDMLNIILSQCAIVSFDTTACGLIKQMNTLSSFCSVCCQCFSVTLM